MICRKALLLLTFLLALCQPCPGREPIDFEEYVIDGVPIKAIIVNLSDRHVKVTPEVIPGLPFSEMDFSGFVMRSSPVAAINGTYFNMETCTPVGEITIEGRQINYSRIGTVLAITKDNRAFFFPGKQFKQINRKNIAMSMGGGPRLLKNGRLCSTFRQEGFKDPHILQPAVRSAAGLSGDGTLVLAVTRSAVSLSRWASTLRALGIKDAMNLDGGTSTGLFYRGIMFVSPGRKLSNILAVHYR